MAQLSQARRVRRRRRVILPALGVSAAALAAASVVVGLMLSSGASPAYARWTPVPSRATPATTSTALFTCSHSFTGTGEAAYTRAFAQRPVLTERRGVYTAVITMNAGRLYSCLTTGTPNQPNFFVSLGTYVPIRPTPGPDQLSAPYTLLTGEGAGNDPAVPGTSPQEIAARQTLLLGGGYGNSALGKTGRDVSAAVFSFANGRTVTATIEHGWYFAWWPFTSTPTSVTITTGNETKSSPVADPSDPRQAAVIPACRPNAPSCVFATKTIVPAPTTTTH